MDTSDASPDSIRSPFQALSTAFGITVCVCLVAWSILWTLFIRPPEGFPAASFFSVEEGVSLRQLSQQLESARFIRSASFFTLSAYISGNQRSVLAGQYFFRTPLSSLELLSRISRGAFGIEYKQLTIPEGSSVKQIGVIAKKELPNFDVARFLTIASTSEGYLFPDTYRFLPNVTPENMREVMRVNFDQKIASIRPALDSFGKPLSDVVKMASIVEEEGRTTVTRRTIAGILWKRISLGMPLQVDSSFLYINGKTTDTLTSEDLKIDSPYNSYLYKGLPPTPITNPGLDSINATISPISTPYLYFLTDKKGVMHYGRTFEEHLSNKAQFLQ